MSLMLSLLGLSLPPTQLLSGNGTPNGPSSIIFPPLLPRLLSLGSLYIHFVLNFSCGHCMFLLCVSHLFTPACVLCCWLYFKEDILIKDSTMASISLRFIDFVGFIFHIFSMTRTFLFSFECYISHHFERKGLTSQDTITTKNYHPWI